MPAWLKVCCPNVSSLQMAECTLTPHLLNLPAPAAAAVAPAPHHGSPTPLTCQHLQRIEMGGFTGQPGSAQWHQHIRHQLAALPSLTSLATRNEEWMQEPALVSTTLTSLELPAADNAQHVAHLAVQFPNLQRLGAGSLTLDDAGLEALLRLPHLERLSVRDLNLRHSHAHRTWVVRHLCVDTPDVGELAHLPLDGVQACVLRFGVRVTPSRDAQAVARVAAAVGRWGGLGTTGGGRVEVEGGDTAALLTTLGPLLTALPAAQRRSVSILSMRDASPATVQALGQQLPTSITAVDLWECTLQPEAWPVLLPSLPATVAKLSLRSSQAPAEEQLVALCSAAVRPVTLSAWYASAAMVGRVKERLAEMDREQLVTFLTS